MLKTVTRLAAAMSLALLFAGCAGTGTSAGGVTAADLGPMDYDAGGTMPCSAGAPTFDEACGWRVLRDGSGGAEIWISNIASETKPAYRVLMYSNGRLWAKDGTPLNVSKDGDTWTVSASDGGYFRFAHAVITGG